MTGVQTCALPISFTPASGIAGSTVTITGNYFSSATTVKIGGVVVSSYNIVNNTTITAVVTTGNSGAIVITNPYGTGTSGTNFILSPTQLALTGGGGYCTGGTGVAVGLSNSQTDMSYQLLKDGSNSGSLIAGTGSALNFGLKTAAGTYTVLANNTLFPATTQTMTGSSVVTINALPTSPGVTGTATICSGTSTSLTASSAATSPVYKWYDAASAGTLLFTGAIYNTANLSSNTTFYAAVTDNNTCTSLSRTSQLVSVTPTSTPTVTISADRSSPVCTGTLVTFTAVPTNGGTTPVYQWKINSTNAGSDNPVFSTSALNSSDVVSVSMTSNVICPSTNPATSSGLSFTVTGTNTWTGSVGGQWSLGSNWACGTVPTSTVNVSIPNGASIVISDPTTALAKNVNIGSTGSLTISNTGSLQVYGNWTDAGTFVPNSGTVVFAGSTQTLNSSKIGRAHV